MAARLTDYVRHSDLTLSHHRAFWDAVQAVLPPGALADGGDLRSIWLAAVPVKPDSSPSPGVISPTAITREQVAYVSGRDPSYFSAQFLRDFNQLVEMGKFQSLNARRMLLAQTCHETGAFRWMSELGDRAYFERLYSGRADLGNRPGTDDAWRYRGCGAIQLTGRANHLQFSQWLQRQGMADPEVMNQGTSYTSVTYPFLSAVCWVERNNWAVICDTGNLDRATRVLNGGYNGLIDRRKYLDRANKIITR